MFLLDEGDRMLAEGFFDAVNTLSNQIPKRRQTLCFSATWPQVVEAACTRLSTTAPLVLRLNNSTALTPNENIQQIVEVMPVTQASDWGDSVMADRLRVILHNIVEEFDSDAKVLVFVHTKKLCGELANELWNRGFRADCISRRRK